MSSQAAILATVARNARERKRLARIQLDRARREFEDAETAAAQAEHALAAAIKAAIWAEAVAAA